MKKCRHDFEYLPCGLYRCTKCGELETEWFVKGYNTGYKISQKIAGWLKKLTGKGDS